MTELSLRRIVSQYEGDRAERLGWKPPDPVQRPAVCSRKTHNITPYERNKTQ